MDLDSSPEYIDKKKNIRKKLEDKDMKNKNDSVIDCDDMKKKSDSVAPPFPKDTTLDNIDEIHLVESQFEKYKDLIRKTGLTPPSDPQLYEFVIYISALSIY